MKDNLICLPRGQEQHKLECICLDLLHSINLFCLREFKMYSPRWPRRSCHKEGDKAARERLGLDLFLELVLVVMGYRSPRLSHLIRAIPVWKSFREKPNGSNSIETLLSVVNLPTDTKFLINFGACSILFRKKGVCEGFYVCTAKAINWNRVATSDNYIIIFAQFKIRRKITLRGCHMRSGSGVHIPRLIRLSKIEGV